MGERWSQSLREEFTVQKMHLSISETERLLQPLWNIPPWSWLLYRCLMLLYTLGWCVYTALLFNTPKWLIFLSHISYCLMCLYHLAAFCNLAAALMIVRYHFKKEQRISDPGSPRTFLLPRCLSFSLRLQWFLHVAQGCLALTVTFLYWAVNYPVTHHPLSAFSINLHGINALQALLDLTLSATPVHLCHFPYLFITGSLYMLFVLLYWLSGSTNIGGQTYIYSVLNFGDHPWIATLCVVGFTLGCLPFFHFVVWNVVLLRDMIAAGTRGRRYTAHRDTWWFGAVGGDVATPSGSRRNPVSCRFESNCEESRRFVEDPSSSLSKVTCSYHTVASSDS